MPKKNNGRKKRKGSKKEKIIANRYKKAGYRVETNKIIKLNQYKRGEIDILATKKDKKIVIESKTGSQTITSSDIIKLSKKSNKVRAKPVLYLGPKTKITNKAKALARELGITIKRG